MCQRIRVNINHTTMCIDVVDKDENILEEIEFLIGAEEVKYLVMNKLFNIVCEFSKKYSIANIYVRCPSLTENVISERKAWSSMDIKIELEKGFSIPVTLY